jgi:hypothetical protein
MIAPASRAARLPLTALVILALVAFTAFSAFTAGRLSALPQQQLTVTPAAPVTRPTAPKPLQASINSCADGGAYVSGDMVGDASPADVYARLCTSR